MEIIHIILGKANPERMNGVNKVVYQLASKQAAAGIKVSVWGITDTLERNYPERNFETLLFKKSMNPFHLNEQLKIEILKKNSQTIFHLHGGWLPLYSSLGNFLSGNKRKFLITAHGAYNTIAMQKSHYLKKIYFHFFEKKLLENAGRIHCIGNSETYGLQNMYENNKTVLIPYGFDPENINSRKKDDNARITFGFLGRLDIYTKGLDLMIDAFDNFQKEVPDSELWIAGSSNQAKQLERTIRTKKLQNKIQLLGPKFGAEKNEILQQMDIFLHPSRNEGLPAAVLEAASFGKPCIVSTNTNIGEQVEKYNAGIVFSQMTPQKLTLAMHQIYKTWLDKQLFHEMESQAIKMVKYEFDWDIILNRLNTELYENI